LLQLFIKYYMPVDGWAQSSRCLFFSKIRCNFYKVENLMNKKCQLNNIMFFAQFSKNMMSRHFEIAPHIMSSLRIHAVLVAVSSFLLVIVISQAAPSSTSSPEADCDAYVYCESLAVLFTSFAWL